MNPSFDTASPYWPEDCYTDPFDDYFDPAKDGWYESQLIRPVSTEPEDKLQDLSSRSEVDGGPQGLEGDEKPASLPRGDHSAQNSATSFKCVTPTEPEDPVFDKILSDAMYDSAPDSLGPASTNEEPQATKKTPVASVPKRASKIGVSPRSSPPRACKKLSCLKFKFKTPRSRNKRKSVPCRPPVDEAKQEDILLFEVFGDPSESFDTEKGGDRQTRTDPMQVLHMDQDEDFASNDEESDPDYEEMQEEMFVVPDVVNSKSVTGQPVPVNQDKKIKTKKIKSQGGRNLTWRTSLRNLIDYGKKHGHLNVPNYCPKYPKLSRWVKRQRYLYVRHRRDLPSAMTEDRIRELEKIGFCWQVQADQWQTRYEELRKYKNEHGHTNVRSDDENRTLACWVKGQRRAYKRHVTTGKSPMTPERMQKLKNLGFRWKLRPYSTTCL